MNVVYEARSESFRVWCANQDDYNFMKLVQSTEFDPHKFLKNYQNSIYGKAVSDMGIYADTDSIHLTDEEMAYLRRDNMATKLVTNIMNSTYGLRATNYKENDKMIKGLDYILVHIDKEPTIIFKKQIVSIAKEEERAYIQCINAGYLSDESYVDIVKQTL